MSDASKEACPKCGAKLLGNCYAAQIQFKCGSWRRNGSGGNLVQSQECRALECAALTRQLAERDTELAEAREQAERLKGLLVELRNAGCESIADALEAALNETDLGSEPEPEIWIT